MKVRSPRLRGGPLNKGAKTPKKMLKTNQKFRVLTPPLLRGVGGDLEIWGMRLFFQIMTKNYD